MKRKGLGPTIDMKDGRRERVEAQATEVEEEEEEETLVPLQKRRVK